MSAMQYETPKELCERLKISRRTLSRQMDQGLPHFKLNHKVLRFDPIEVDRWLAERGEQDDD